MRRRLALWCCICAALVVGGCSPAIVPVSPTALPAPQLKLTHAPAGTAVAPARARPSPLPVRTPDPAIHDSLADMARSVYGNRMIARIQIPVLRIDAPVVPVGWQATDATGDEAEWDSPEASVGWAVSSALPDQAGNVILYGHNNLHSNVFMHLADVSHGDEIVLDTGEKSYRYRVESVEILPVEDLEQDTAAYERYFQPGETAQLTIVSCWPPTSNTHRVIVTALP